MKITDKLKQKQNSGEQSQVLFSFEYFPPKTEAGLQNLYARLDRMANWNPAWIDITWGAGGSTSELTLEIASNAINFFGLEVLMHLTCTNMSVEAVKSALEQAKEAGIQNILALRGDPPKGSAQWEAVEGGFAHAIDLVRYIRKEYGDYFCIAVAGYPEGHLEAPDRATDLQHLKEKVDAGADFIVTQLFYDNQEFFNFVRDCKDLGINIPIVPGIMPIQSYDGFKRMTGFCKTKVPQEVLDSLEPIKDDDQAVKAYGVQQAVAMCKELIQFGITDIHFYTLNLEASTGKILEGLGLIDLSQVRRALPWRKSARAERAREEVRPIFWANRPKSYVARTITWDEFPNGRWGDSRSAAFGDWAAYPSLSKDMSGRSIRERAYIWGESPATEQDVCDVFVSYVSGKIQRLPWCEGAIHSETTRISETIVNLNRSGFLTINSQPAVNGAPSTDPVVGWGPRLGYIYQKAYVEFFVSPAKLEALLERLKKLPWLTYQAVNNQGVSYSNNTEGKVNAVTWGVFEGSEIIQPTVVDPVSFMVWKQEAFSLWDEWSEIYEEGSASQQLINHIKNSYFLVNIVDNDYINGNLFAVFNESA